MKPSGLQTPTFLEEDDDEQQEESPVGSSSPFDQRSFLDALDAMVEPPGDGQPSMSDATAEGHHFPPDGAVEAPLAEPATTASDAATDTNKAGPSFSSGVQHGYQLRWRIPRPPNAFMLFAQEKRRSVAAENPNENNQRVSSRLGKLWRSLSAADKEPYQRRAAEAAAVHRRKYPDYVYNPREARRRKEQERRAKAIAGKVKKDTSADEEPEQGTCAAQSPRTPDFSQLPQHPPSPPQLMPMPQRLRRRTACVARGTQFCMGEATPTGRPTAIVPPTLLARSGARQSSCPVHYFPGTLPPLQRGAIRSCTVGAAQSATARRCTLPSPLVACGRDCAAVPRPRMNGRGLPEAGDAYAGQIGWFVDNIQGAPAHMTFGVAATPVLCWPVIAAAGPAAMTPSLPLLLPATVAPALTRHHFAAPVTSMQQTRQDAAAAPAAWAQFNTMQHEQLRNGANAVRNTMNGTAVSAMASRQHQAAALRRSPAQAAASGAMPAMLWPPGTGQAMQRQDIGGPFPSCAYAGSHEMSGTAVAYPYTTPVYCAGASEQSLVGASTGHGGGSIVLGTSTLLQEPATIGSNQPRSGPTLDRYHPRPMMQQLQPAVRLQHTGGQRSQPSQLSMNMAGWQQPSWGGPFGPDIDLAMQLMVGRSVAQQQQRPTATPTYSAAPVNEEQFGRPT